MSQVRQYAADSYREIRTESRAAVLGMLGISEVSNDAKSLKSRDSKPSEDPMLKNKLIPHQPLQGTGSPQDANIKQN